MRFQKGQPRMASAGRKPGSKNKRTVARVADILADKEINPVDEILELMPLLMPAEKVKAWFDLLSYCQAKPKDADLDGDENDSEELLKKFENVTNETLLKIVRPGNEAE